MTGGQTVKDGNRGPTEGLLKIGELAKETGTNVSTLKYYIKEGMITPAVKTGKNMSWYDPSCIDTVKMIRMLQKERFYPLRVIRGLLNTESMKQPPEMALLDAIHKVDDTTKPETVGAGEAARRSGLNETQIGLLSQAGIISAPKKRQKGFTEEDLAVMELVRKRLDAGISFEQSIEAFRIYDRSLRNAVHEDIDSFIDVILQPDLTPENGTQRIRVSDETLDRFIELRRRAYNRRYGKAYIERLYRFSAQCAAAVGKLADVFRKYGFADEAEQCSRAAAGDLTETEESALYFRMFLGEAPKQDADLISRITDCFRSREFFRESFCRPVSDPGKRVLADALRCLWLTMAPEPLQCGDRAEEASAGLYEVLKICEPRKCELIHREILSCVPSSEVKENG